MYLINEIFNDSRWWAQSDELQINETNERSKENKNAKRIPSVYIVLLN